MTIDNVPLTAAQAVDLTIAFQRLTDVLPVVTRYNKRTDEYEPAQEVRLTLRRKTGQYYAGVGKVNATGTSWAEAVSGLAERLEDIERDRAATGKRAADR